MSIRYKDLTPAQKQLVNRRIAAGVRALVNLAHGGGGHYGHTVANLLDLLAPVARKHVVLRERMRCSKFGRLEHPQADVDIPSIGKTW